MAQWVKANREEIIPVLSGCLVYKPISSLANGKLLLIYIFDSSILFFNQKRSVYKEALGHALILC